MMLNYAIIFTCAGLILSAATGVATENCENCVKQIDQQLIELRLKPDVPLPMDILRPNITCVIKGLTRMTRDNTTFACPKNSTNGTTYQVPITLDNVFVKCDINVSTKLADLPKVLTDFVGFVVAQALNKCPWVKFGAAAILSGLGSDLFSLSNPSMSGCYNASNQIVNTIGSLVNGVLVKGETQLSLLGNITDFQYTPTVIIQNDVSRLEGFQVGKVESDKFKMWCEGGKDQPALKDACTCLLSTNAQKAVFVGILSFFMTCFPDLNAYVNGTYAVVADALSCAV